MDLQAMDRCHRIGQTKPIHVYRLSTAQSVEGRILKRPFSKLKLEHVVIGKGQFQQERTTPSGTDGMEGILKGFDQATNIILDESHERVYSTKMRCRDVIL